MNRAERERLRGILHAVLQRRFVDDVFGVSEAWLLKRMALYEFDEEDVRTLVRLHEECAVRLPKIFTILQEEDTDFDEVAVCFFAKAELKDNHAIGLPVSVLLRAKQSFDLADDAVVGAVLSLSDLCEQGGEDDRRSIVSVLEGLCVLAETGRCSTIEEGFALDPDACSEKE